MQITIKRQGARYFLWWILLTGVVFTGCQTSSYYSQAILGHMRILGNERPISRVLRDPDAPTPLKQKLALVMEIREFAEASLHLPAGGAYHTYVALDRPHVVWNVFAAPEFSLAPKTWRYPFVGVASYRGYFSRADAERFAETLANEGCDVYVGGVTAYSTLGWFDDPVLSTFVYLKERRLAALLFHELAHQLLYVHDDTAFNESFATAVEREGLRRWLAGRNGSEKSGEYERHLLEHRRRDQFMEMLMDCRGRLATLYGQERPVEEARREKARILAGLQEDYARLKEEWDGWAGWDAWFHQPVNNARLASAAMYYQYVPAFTRLLEACDGDLERFYETCGKLAKKNREERRRILAAGGVIRE
ncbi:MAG: aminopeptidase [Desulfobacterales bacterium]|nr:aminopeptidase [Desulfobacterales bacterium]